MLMIAAFSHQMEGLDVVVVWRYPAREGNIAEVWAKKMISYMDRTNVGLAVYGQTWCGIFLSVQVKNATFVKYKDKCKNIL